MLPNQPLYIRAGVLAKALGVPRKMLIDDALSGRLPLRVQRFGASGIAHVAASDAAALLERANPAHTALLLQIEGARR